MKALTMREFGSKPSVDEIEIRPLSKAAIDLNSRFIKLCDWYHSIGIWSIEFIAQISEEFSFDICFGNVIRYRFWDTWVARELEFQRRFESMNSISRCLH